MADKCDEKDLETVVGGGIGNGGNLGMGYLLFVCPGKGNCPLECKQPNPTKGQKCSNIII